MTETNASVPKMWGLKCPVCLDNMYSNIHVCATGHSICEPCKCAVNLCPLCNAKFFQNHNYNLEQVAVGLQEKKESALANEDYKNIIRISCTNCKDAVSTTIKIFLCNTGHSICEKCQVSNSICTECSSSIGNQRNFNLEQVLQDLIENPINQEPIITSSSEDIQISIKILTGKILKLNVSPSHTIKEVMKEIHDQTGMDEGFQRLLFKGKQLDKIRTLTSYNINNGDSLFLVGRLLGGLE